MKKDLVNLLSFLIILILFFVIYFALYSISKNRSEFIGQEVICNDIVPNYDLCRPRIAVKNAGSRPAHLWVVVINPDGSIPSQCNVAGCTIDQGSVEVNPFNKNHYYQTYSDRDFANPLCVTKDFFLVFSVNGQQGPDTSFDNLAELRAIPATEADLSFNASHILYVNIQSDTDITYSNSNSCNYYSKLYLKRTADTTLGQWSYLRARDAAKALTSPYDSYTSKSNFARFPGTGYGGYVPPPKAQPTPPPQSPPPPPPPKILSEQEKADAQLANIKAAAIMARAYPNSQTQLELIGYEMGIIPSDYIVKIPVFKDFACGTRIIAEFPNGSYTLDTFKFQNTYINIKNSVLVDYYNNKRNDALITFKFPDATYFGHGESWSFGPLGEIANIIATEIDESCNCQRVSINDLINNNVIYLDNSGLFKNGANKIIFNVCLPGYTTTLDLPAVSYGSKAFTQVLTEFFDDPKMFFGEPLVITSISTITQLGVQAALVYFSGGVEEAADVSFSEAMRIFISNSAITGIEVAQKTVLAKIYKPLMLLFYYFAVDNGEALVEQLVQSLGSTVGYALVASYRYIPGLKDLLPLHKAFEKFRTFAYSTGFQDVLYVILTISITMIVGNQVSGVPLRSTFIAQILYISIMLLYITIYYAAINNGNLDMDVINKFILCYTGKSVNEFPSPGSAQIEYLQPGNGYSIFDIFNQLKTAIS